MNTNFGIKEHNLKLLQEFCQIIPELEFKIIEDRGEVKYFEADCGNYTIEMGHEIHPNEKEEVVDAWILSHVTVHHSWENPPETTENELLLSTHLHEIAKALMKHYMETHVDYVLRCMEEDASAPPEDEHRLEEGPL